ncbi:hypothetical protein C8F01DRAFT_1076627 [Mycena amicta]|nr:hypothetical protein C8F01DRAFT_1076627 [Mycena amicta]
MSAYPPQNATAYLSQLQRNVNAALPEAQGPLKAGFAVFKELAEITVRISSRITDFALKSTAAAPSAATPRHLPTVWAQKIAEQDASADDWQEFAAEILAFLAVSNILRMRSMFTVPQELLSVPGKLQGAVRRATRQCLETFCRQLFPPAPIRCLRAGPTLTVVASRYIHALCFNQRKELDKLRRCIMKTNGFGVALAAENEWTALEALFEIIHYLGYETRGIGAFERNQKFQDHAFDALGALRFPVKRLLAITSDPGRWVATVEEFMLTLSELSDHKPQVFDCGYMNLRISGVNAVHNVVINDHSLLFRTEINADDANAGDVVADTLQFPFAGIPSISHSVVDGKLIVRLISTCDPLVGAVIESNCSVKHRDSNRTVLLHLAEQDHDRPTSSRGTSIPSPAKGHPGSPRHKLSAFNPGSLARRDPNLETVKSTPSAGEEEDMRDRPTSPREEDKCLPNIAMVSYIVHIKWDYEMCQVKSSNDTIVTPPVQRRPPMQKNHHIFPPAALSLLKQIIT